MKLYNVVTPEISTRKHPIHGGLSDYINTPAFLPMGVSTLTFYIHGFNVDKKDALTSYENVTKLLIHSGMSKQWLRTICPVFWPGNKTSKINWLTPAWSKASYPLQISTAKESGKMLSGYLNWVANLHPNLQFVFIAHSLGCRVLLETLKELMVLNPNNIHRIKLMALMAAAVPVYMIERLSYFDIFDLGNNRACLFSKKDRILQRAFPIGQTAAGEGILPVAVGRKGGPNLSLWTSGWLDADIGHGEYWGNKRVANFLTNSMGIATARMLPVRNLNPRQMFRKP
ncbi:MAG TPA: alpha/beta hydrolase [Ferruginibacter sp.]|nr:alpha/beta hydrolase [Ferruginibacter sp.]